MDRQALAQLVFGDAAARRRLNAATHLPVAAELLRLLLWHWLSLEWLVVGRPPCVGRAGGRHGGGNRAVDAGVLEEGGGRSELGQGQGGMAGQQAEERQGSQWPPGRGSGLRVAGPGRPNACGRAGCG